MAAKGQKPFGLQPGTYVARPKSVRKSPIHKGARKQLRPAKSKKKYAKKVVGIEKAKENVGELKEITRVLRETRKLASNRPIDPRGIHDYNTRLFPVVRAMERQVGWSDKYDEARRICARLKTHYNQLMQENPRPSTAEKLRDVNRTCNVWLPSAKQSLEELRDSFAPCFCPSGSVDPTFEYMAMVERFKKGRPSTFEETQLAEAGERFAREMKTFRPKGKRGRRSLAEIRALQEANKESWRENWPEGYDPNRPVPPPSESYKYPTRTVRKPMKRHSSPAQKRWQERFARASKKCKGLTKSKREACMRKELKKK